MVGDYFTEGTPFPKDYEKAEYWYKRALENGDTYALHGLDVLKILEQLDR